MQSTTLLNMFQSPIASAELGATPLAAQLGGKTGKAGAAGEVVDGKFADVLGLVSNMELADSQDVMGKEALKADLGQVQDAKLKAMQAQMNAAEISQLGQMNATNTAANMAAVALNGEGIGRQMNSAEIAPGSAGATVTSGDPKATSAQILLDGMQTAKPVKTEAQPDGDAVTQWAHALVRGDIKEVKLEQGGDGVGPREMAAQKLAQGSAVEKALLNPKLAQEAAQPKTQMAVQTAPQTAAQPVAQGPMLTEAQTQKAPSSQEATAALGASVKPAASEVAVAPKATGINVNAQSAEVKSVSSKGADSGSKSDQGTESKSQGKASDHKGVQKGSDFLLDKSVDHQVSNADFRSSFGAMAAGYTTHAAVVKGHEMGQPGDSRVQPQTLQFVADKVNELKTNGGGRLHVALNTAGLGSIEINVGMRAGQVHVQVSASNPETLKLLQGAKSELVGKLANISSPMVEINAKHDLSLKADHRAEVLKPFSSESFMTAHKVDATANAEVKVSSNNDFVRHSFEGSASGETAVGMSSHEQSANKFGSDQGQSHSQPQFERSFNAATDQGEGRDKAFEKWERSFKDRKSA